MNIEKLSSYIQKYKEKEEVAEENGFKEREERIKYYSSFDFEKIKNMNYDDFTTYISTLWASVMYGNKKYLVDKIISYNKKLEHITSLLADFIFGKDNIEKRWDNFYEKAGMFGPSYMSEILSYYYPDEYVITNSQVIKALEKLGCTDLPHNNYQWTGEKYLEICKIVKEIGEILKKKEIKVENLLSVDYFLWEVSKFNEGNDFYETKDKNISVNKERDKKSIHDEMIDKILDIGAFLGFETEKEVKVANGAKVDAVWKVKIGNMGMISYVFEVQSHGSIDSLILNLQKAKNNKSVQKLVAVSDTEQLLKIKKESEPVPGLELSYWDFNEVSMVYENLNNAFSSINKLELVPLEFGELK